MEEVLLNQEDVTPGGRLIAELQQRVAAAYKGTRSISHCGDRWASRLTPTVTR